MVTMLPHHPTFAYSVRVPSMWFLKTKCQGKKKHININTFAGLSWDWVGAKILFCVFLFGSFPMGEKKHINKVPVQIPGQSHVNFVYVPFSLCVFFAPKSVAVTAGIGIILVYLDLATSMFFQRPQSPTEQGQEAEATKAHWHEHPGERG